MFSRRKAFVVVVFASLVALVAAGFALLVRERRPEVRKIPERVVKLFRIQPVHPDSKLSYPGKIQPVRQANLFFRVSGPVIEQNLHRGQRVKAGEVLMRIDPRDYQREIERLTHEIEAQKIEDDLLDTEYRRYLKLWEAKAVSKATFDAARTKKLNSGAQLKRLGTLLKVAQDKLHDTVLKAPFDAMISEINVDQYEMAQAYVTALQLQNLGELEIRVNFPEGNIPDISLTDGFKYRGRAFKVTFPGRGDRSFEANFTEFRPESNSESGTYELRLRMKQPRDFIVLPGMTVEVHGLPRLERVHSGKLKVPYAAVFRRDGGEAVWVYHPEDQKLELRKVRAGQSVDGDAITISDGLKPGEFVVAAGGDWLTAETRVTVLNREVLHEAR